MDTLASNADVAGSLGLAVGSLTATQTLRLPLILAKLCGDFRRAAGCEFTPGTTTVRLLTVDGRLTLPDKLDGVNEILNDDGDVVSTTPNPGVVSKVQNYHDGKEVDFTVVGQDVLPKVPRLFGPERAGTGDLYVVTYTHNAAVPDDVRGSVAMCAARYLTVDPKSAVAQSTMLTAEGYHQRMAQWVADTVKLSPDALQTAISYRSLPSMPVVQKMGHRPTMDRANTRFVVGGGYWY